MEPHPVPQNVTNFQFHLIGDMTLKQFGYLAFGAGLAYFLFVFASHDYPLIAWPLIVISSLSGAALAFLPINSRPLDSWIVAFFRAIYSPTKRIWKKGNKSFKEETTFNSRLSAYLATNQPTIKIQTTVTPTTPIPAKMEPPTAQPGPSLLSKDDLAKTVDLAKQAQSLQMRIIQSERQLSQIKQASQGPNPVPASYSSQVNKIMTDLQTMVAQASAIKDQLETVTKPELSENIVAAVPPQAIREKVKVVIPSKPKQSELALTTFPNVISGVVKDLSGNYLEGAVAVIYDKEGLPVRALKTNKLGQFSGSTPLPNGTYTLELEKENFGFDVLQIELSGEVLPALMITSKN